MSAKPKNHSPEVSVIMPCLNEEETVGKCIKKTFDSFKRLNIDGEVIVCDNGSTDKSVQISSLCSFLYTPFIKKRVPINLWHESFMIFNSNS